MNSRRHRAPIWFASILLALSLLLAPTLMSGAGAHVSREAATAAQDRAQEPTLRLAAVPDSAQLHPGDELRLQILVTAGSRSLPADTRVQLGLQPRALTSRTAVHRWSSAPLTSATGNELTVVDLGERLEAGASRQLDLVVPAGQVPLTEADQWGPRGVALTLQTDDGERLDVVRTFVVWRGPAEGEQQPTLVTVVIPLTGGQADPTTGALPTTTYSLDTRPDSRLDATLAAAAVPGTVVALDPLLLNQGTNAVTVNPQTAPGEPPPPELQAWQSRLLGVVGSHETLLLDYADPDVNALVHADQGELLRRAHTLALQQAAASIPERSTVRSDIAFPPDGVADDDSLRAQRDLGRTKAVILAERAVPLRADQPMTASGRAELETEDGVQPLLVADQALSDTLADVGRPESAQGGPAAVQRLRADGAALARELPGRSRHILVTAPRDWAPDTHNAQLAVQALVETPWSGAAGLQSLIDAEPGPARADPRISADDRERELPDFGLQDIGDTLTEIESLVVVLADAQGLAHTVDAQAASLASWQWRADPDEWRLGRRDFATTAQTLRSAVHIVPGSPLTQVSRNVRLPVTVQNDAAQPIRVVLDVTPQTNRLVVPDRVTVDVPANSRAVGYVPVRGVSNGDTSVRVQLQLTNGIRVGEPTVIPVQVRADWESKGAGILTGAVALVLLLGLVRSIRRGTRARRSAPMAAEQAPPDGPPASSP